MQKSADKVAYKPQSIILPKDCEFSRNFIKEISSEDQIGYDQGKLGCYDSHTIFFDIFLSDTSHEIIAIGPPLHNLKKHLLPANIIIDDCNYRLIQKIDHERLATWTTSIPEQIYKKLLVNTVNHASYAIVFSNSMKFSFELQPLTMKKPQGRVITTIQKNNKITWIRDWIDYYKKTFAIEHVFLYDNNSENHQQLIEVLSSSTVTIVAWNFPFGITGAKQNPWANRFSQIGQLNHCKIRFSDYSTSIFNFDIDELLVVKNISIHERIKRIHQEKIIMFSGYQVPHKLDLPENYSYTNFQDRYVHPQYEGKKYIISKNIRGVLESHNITHKKTFLYFLKRALEKCSKLVGIHFKRAPIKDAYFLHYKSITTNWQTWRQSRFTVDEADQLQTVEDRSVVEILEHK